MKANIFTQIVNATVSQSVPANVTKSMQSVAKVFVGDLIETARKVQTEWVAKTDEPQVEPGVKTPEWPYEEDEHVVARSIHPKVKPKAAPMGALRPDHVREAWRRNRAGAEGGNVGSLRLWHNQQQSGVERFGVKTKGRSLFK